MPGVAPGSHLAVGVDGGGSKTLAVVVDQDGRELGRATAGSSNYTAVGVEQAAAAVTAAVAEAVRIAGGQMPIRALWAGLSGIDRPGAREQFMPLIQPLACEIRLTNDAELVFGALEGGIGVVLIAGTGSIALGRDANGNTARAGGWGHLMGDEGSGYDIGRRGLMAAARAADGRGPGTALLEALMRHFEVDRPLDMIAPAYRSTEKAAIASLASIVFECAQVGDQVAAAIITAAASELAHAAIAAGSQLGLDNEPMPLALAGGLMIGHPSFRNEVVRVIRAARPVGQVSVVDDPALRAAQGLVGAG
jgi:N-acetylglucosamine kinase-like BadF-type ATPase